MAERHYGANRSQRARRASNPRIDYYPSPQSLSAIAEKRGQFYPLNTNSGVIDAIIAEWVELNRINNQSKSNSMTSAQVPELLDAMRARMTSAASGRSLGDGSSAHEVAKRMGDVPAWSVSLARLTVAPSGRANQRQPDPMGIGSDDRQPGC